MVTSNPKHVLSLQNGQTPLMLAAEQGSLDIVQELIRRGANVNLDDVVSTENTPTRFLFVCVACGCLETGRCLVMCPLCCQDCWSALISAAKEGHVEVVKELLENSAYIEHRDMVRTETHGKCS